MPLLTIGAFAALTRLSPKALRLYDELGLLRPARVDPLTGYRWYAPAQQERARLVAWLRRLDMPLARIRDVCALGPAEAAEQVRVFWAEVEADVLSRRDLAGFLIDELAGRHLPSPAPADPDLDGPGREGPAGLRTPGTAIRYAVRSDPGLIRNANQDAAFADARMIAVADGFGSGGDRAGQVAIDALRASTGPGATSDGALLNALHDAVARANHAIGELGGSTEPHPVGTTLTAMIWNGSRVGLVHIGDSRAYLRRDGRLFQITQDHSRVQAMVDDGRLTPDEAAAHPERAMLLRALDGRAGPAADVRLHEAGVGDRYLLCSDGLSAVVPAAEITRVIETATDPESAVGDLIDLARAGGAPDNVSAVVADVVAC